jgi:hypothetical protein
MGDAAESRFCAVGWGTVGVELDRFQNRRGGRGDARLAAPGDDRRGERNCFKLYPVAPCETPPRETMRDHARPGDTHPARRERTALT